MTPKKKKYVTVYLGQWDHWSLTEIPPEGPKWIKDVIRPKGQI